MKTYIKITFETARIINIIALLFLLAGLYGLAITGALQVFSGILFLLAYPKNKLIYVYFGLVGLFFLLWDRHGFNMLFCIPIFLIFFLTYILYQQKKNNKLEN